MTRAQLDKARAKYRRQYDRLYVASMRANDEAESLKIDGALAAANDQLAQAEREFAATGGARGGVVSVKDANRRLALVGSENRAEVLVEELNQTPSRHSARKLLREWFNVCEALAPWAFDLRQQFLRVGYVSDNDEELEFPLTVYRAAYADDDIENALSWTTSRETAEFFARHHTSIRAKFLGLYRDDVDMLIWQGTCHSALAYFTGRGESEVVPDEITDIEPIAQLVPVPAE